MKAIPATSALRNLALCFVLALGCSILRGNDYDNMRTKLVEVFLGNDLYTTPDAGLAAKLTSLDNSISSVPASSAPSSAGSGYWDTLNTDTNRTYLWADLQFTSGNAAVSSRITSSYTRLLQMATAYYTKGSGYYGKTALLTDIKSALTWMNQNQYNYSLYGNGTGAKYPTTAPLNNWFDWQIGTPKVLTKILLLMENDLSGTSTVSDAMSTVNSFIPYATSQTAAGAPTMTAANLTDQAISILYEGILLKDSSKISNAVAALLSTTYPALPYVSPGATPNTAARDGFFQDGSYVQHAANPYIGGYGISMISDISLMLYALDSTSFAVTDSSKWNAYRWVFDSVIPMIYNGNLMDGFVGRNISFGPNLGVKKYNPALDGGQMIVAMYYFLLTAPTDNSNLGSGYPSNPALAYKQALKGWLQSDPGGQILYYAPIYVYLELEQIAGDSSVTATSFAGHKLYAAEDRVIHVTPNYGFALSMSSNRVNNYESGGNQNLEGWYTGDGMAYTYPQDPAVFYNFWQTVNPYRLPGTTVDTQTRTKTCNWINYLPSISMWVGGVTLDGVYGAAGMDYAPPGDLGQPSTGPSETGGIVLTPTNLVAKKSWFMFDEEVVALGAGITASGLTGNGWDGSARRIETIVDNHRIQDTNTNVLYVNNTTTPQISGLGDSATFTSTNWIYLQGNTSTDASSVGFYFPTPTTVQGLREARTGDYTTINASYPQTRVFGPAADTYARDDGTTHGTEPTLEVKNDVGGYARETYIKFDLTYLIPNDNVTFTNATVTINPTSIGTTTLPITHTAELVPASANGWTESSLNWSNKPTSSPLIHPYWWSPTVGTPVTIDVTADLLAALQAHVRVISLHIYATSGVDSNANVAYAAREYPSSGLRPTLTLTGYKEPVTSNYVNLWINHGSSPSNATYAYAILPNMSASDVAAYATTPGFHVLQNDTQIQAVKELSLNIVGANFWQHASNTLSVDGSSFLTADNKCSVMTREGAGSIEVAISDPTQNDSSAVNLVVNRSATGTLGTPDTGIAVTATSPTIQFSTAVSGSYGKTFHATFALLATLNPTGDSYVWDQNPDTNYGSSTSLVVKADAANYNRKAFIQFDVSSILVAPNKATVTLYPTSVGATGIVHQANAVTASWSESGITWNNQPAAGSLVATWTVPAAGTPVSIDVTSLVAAAVSSHSSTISLEISASTTQGTQGSATAVSYAARDYGTVGYRPVLTLNSP